jgi:hypothetical protein
MTKSPLILVPVTKAQIEELFAQHGLALDGCHRNDVYQQFEDGNLTRPNTKQLHMTRYSDDNDDTICIIFEYTRVDGTTRRTIRCLRVAETMYLVPNP